MAKFRVSLWTDWFGKTFASKALAISVHGFVLCNGIAMKSLGSLVAVIISEDDGILILDKFQIVTCMRP